VRVCRNGEELRRSALATPDEVTPLELIGWRRSNAAT
jgi:hypothetical protein